VQNLFKHFGVTFHGKTMEVLIGEHVSGAGFSIYATATRSSSSS